LGRPRNLDDPVGRGTLSTRPAGRWDGADVETPVQRARPWSAKLSTDRLIALQE
jgi:hypothetical protein